jgi:hypothetical protein
VQSKHIRGKAMSSDGNPALVHIRRMELRIAQQTVSLESLRQFGGDTSAAIRRLKLLRHALDEMRIQLAQLSPTNLDEKRPFVDLMRLRLGL